jgi:AcrR family transcriptional regulator
MHTENGKRGLRERNKEDKLRTIREAARQQFVTNGYENTTTRDIAKQADVGIGTLFTYACDKRDLLFLTINDRTMQATDVARKDADGKGDFIEGLVAIFRPLYEIFASDPEIFQVALKEFHFQNTTPLGVHTAKFETIRCNFFDTISAFVRAAQLAEKIATVETAEFSSRTIFFLYQSEVRHWLCGAGPEVEEGLQSLRRRLTLLFNGLK